MYFHLLNLQVFFFTCSQLFRCPSTTVLSLWFLQLLFSRVRYIYSADIIAGAAPSANLARLVQTLYLILATFYAITSAS